MAEVEEYISSLITYVAHKKGDPNAAISSVPLAVLNYKDFTKREMTIDAPDLNKTADGDDEEYTHDIQKLRERFQDKVDKSK